MCKNVIILGIRCAGSAVASELSEKYILIYLDIDT